MRGWVDDVLLPAVFASLPSAFPEFGWKGVRAGWRATAEQFTHERFSCRADRVVCQASRGILVHGGESLHWLAYLNGGEFPTGARWHEVVEDLAARVGVRVPSREAEQTKDPMDIAIGQVLAYAQERLGSEALQFLASRGVSASRAAELGFGWIESKASLLASLPLGHGVLLAGVLTEKPAATSRWDRRIICPWKDSRGHTIGLWGRIIKKVCPPDEKKYLVSGRRASLWGHDIILNQARRTGTLIGVEGFFDAIALQDAGFPAGSLGGAAVTSDLLVALERAGLKRFVVVLDGDDAGYRGVARLMETMVRYEGELEVCVVPPSTMGGLDPDELVRAGRWPAVYEAAQSWLTLWAGEQLSRVSPSSSEFMRVAAARRCAATCQRVAARMSIEVGEVGRLVESATGIREEFFALATATQN